MLYEVITRKVKTLSPDAPLLHPDHTRPVTRRDFIRQGLLTGMATVTAPSLFGLFANPREARAALSPDLLALKAADRCDISTLGGGKIPFVITSYSIHYTKLYEADSTHDRQASRSAA